MAAVEPVKCTRYRCPHCRKTGSKRAYMQKHADGCAAVPDNRGCKTCRNDAAEFVLASDASAYRKVRTCAIGARDESIQIITHCQKWSPNRDVAAT